MRRGQAAAGSAVFFVVAPLMVAGVLPWWISRSGTWRYDPPVWTRVVGVVLVVAGAAVLVHSFVRFVAARGTPAPGAPTERLVVDGAYRYVRNPMYVAVVTVCLGQGLFHGSGLGLAYAGLVWAVTAAFVRLYEEPVLRRQFGPAYDAYRSGVPAWLPRLRPWAG